MIEGGEDPMTIFRRAIAMAAEDIGLADPEALKLAVAARDAYHMLGAPEGYLPLAQMVIYLATAPKSNSAKVALDAALEAAREHPGRRRCRCTSGTRRRSSMKELGYHEGYQYAHDVPEAYIPQEYLPDALRGTRVLRAGPVRVREGDREAAGVVGGASRARAQGERTTRGDGTGTVNGGVIDASSDVGVRRRPRSRSTAGCATLGQAAFKEPVVHLQDVRVTALGLTGGNARRRLSVYNPNGFDSTRRA